MAGIATAVVVGSLVGANASGKAAKVQADAARESGELAYQTSIQQIAAQREALDKQIASQGAIVDKQLLAQRDALDQQLALQRQVYDQSRADFAPYRESGTANVNQLKTLLGIGGDTSAADYGRFRTADFTPADFTANKDPGYGFRISEGLKAIDRQSAARGGLISGNALKAAAGYSSDLASQEYNAAFNRFQTIRGNTLQPFQMGTAAGQNAAATQGQANANYGSAGGQAISNYGQGVSGAYGAQGQGANTAYGNYGQGVSGAYGAYNTNATNALTGGANAAASGYVGQANAINQGISGLSNQYYQNRMLDMFNPNSVSNLNRTYGANNVYGSGAANYQPSYSPTTLGPNTGPF